MGEVTCVACHSKPYWKVILGVLSTGGIERRRLQLPCTVSQGSMLKCMLLLGGGKDLKFTFLTPGEGVSQGTPPMGEGVEAPSLWEKGLRSLLLGREIPEEGIFLGRGLGRGMGMD